MPKAGKPVHDWTTEECAVWVQQQLASQVLWQCGEAGFRFHRSYLIFNETRFRVQGSLVCWGCRFWGRVCSELRL